MDKQTSDTFNRHTQPLTKEMLKVLDARVGMLGKRTRDRYEQMKDHFMKEVDDLIERQEEQHDTRFQTAVTDYIHSMNGPRMGPPASPKVLQKAAEEYAARRVANREEREQSDLWRSNIAQLTRYVDRETERQAERNQGNTLMGNFNRENKDGRKR